MRLFQRDPKHKAKPKRKKTPKEIAWEWFSGIGIPLILALVIKASVVEAYVIPSGSMENTLMPGDQILGNKFVYGMKLPIPFTDIHLPAIEEPKTGDIVIFTPPHDPRNSFIKRCIATEGQTVEIKNKKLYVDGVLMELPEEGKYLDNGIIPFLPHEQKRGGLRDNFPLTTVPEGKLFVMGDNRDNSADSRFWGFASRDQVHARAMLVLWSWEYPGEMNTSNGDMTNIDIWAYSLKNLPYLLTHLRWGRFFTIAS